MDSLVSRDNISIEYIFNNLFNLASSYDEQKYKTFRTILHHLYDKSQSLEFCADINILLGTHNRFIYNRDSRRQFSDQFRRQRANSDYSEAKIIFKNSVLDKQENITLLIESYISNINTENNFYTTTEPPTTYNNVVRRNVDSFFNNFERSQIRINNSQCDTTNNTRQQSDLIFF